MLLGEHKLPAPLARCCELLAEDRAEEAVGLLYELPEELADTPDATVLTGLAELRIPPCGESWLRALLRAWDDAGNPSPFAFVCDDPFVPLLAAGRPAAEPQGPDGLLELVLGDHPLASAVVPVLAPDRQGEQDALARRAVAALPRARTLEHRLWLAALLSCRNASPALAPAARDALRSLHAAMAEDHPADFALVASSVLADGADGDPPLADAQVAQLTAAIARHQPRITVGALYDRIVVERGAESCLDRYRCFQDALALTPLPLPRLASRAATSLSAAPPARRAVLVALLRAVAQRYASAETLAERCSAARLARLAAEHHPDPGLDVAAAAQLENVRRVSCGDGRLPLCWPIEPLRREIVDALAHHEWDLMERTLPGPLAGL